MRGKASHVVVSAAIALSERGAKPLGRAGSVMASVGDCGRVSAGAVFAEAVPGPGATCKASGAAEAVA